jgi:hypothetical protein
MFIEDRGFRDISREIIISFSSLLILKIALRLSEILNLSIEVKVSLAIFHANQSLLVYSILHFCGCLEKAGIPKHVEEARHKLSTAFSTHREGGKRAERTE